MFSAPEFPVFKSELIVKQINVIAVFDLEDETDISSYGTGEGGIVIGTKGSQTYNSTN